MQVKAAVASGGNPPVYKNIEIEAPKPGEVAIEVIAVGYSNLVKARAEGRHYSSGSMDKESIVGVDGVRKVKGSDDVVYFVNYKPGKGTYLEVEKKKKNFVYPFPKETDEKAPARVAALANGAMASYMALFDRVGDVPADAKIVVLGATGTAGQLAIQLTKKIFGAKTVVGVGRSAEKLAKLKQSQPLLDGVIALDEDEDKIIASELLNDVDIVLDFLWGKPATKILAAAVKSKTEKSKRLAWVQIGLLAGEDFSVPAAFLRSCNLVILGSGIGPLSAEQNKKVLQGVTEALALGKLEINYRAAALADIAEEWAKPMGDVRTFFKVK